MSDEKKPLHLEVTFLPPLNMVLTFLDREARPQEPRETPPQQEDDLKGKDVQRIIKRLNQQDKN